MELKAIDILNKFESLTKLADKELDLSTAITIAKNLKELSLSKDIIDKKRNVLIVKYAEKDENENVVQNDDGSVKILDVTSFNKEISDILDTTIEVNISKLKKDKMTDIKISAKDILSITDILE